MNTNFENINFSHLKSKEIYKLHPAIKKAYEIIIEFNNDNSNKLCLVFPIKSNIAQWVSFLIALECIHADFKIHKQDILDSYKHYRKGQLLILNNEAIVKWDGYDDNYIRYSTKAQGKNGPSITFAKHKDVIKLEPAPKNRKNISSFDLARIAFNKIKSSPIDDLLGIFSFGNKQFIKNSICLINKFKDYEITFNELFLNRYRIEDYVQAERINESGKTDNFSPLIISNNFERLIYYLQDSKFISKIIIDGFSLIQDNKIDFIDTDTKNIPTILISDLSEVDNFVNIADLGFNFRYFTRNDLKLNALSGSSPFYSFAQKLNNFLSFNIQRVLCYNTNLESAVIKLHSVRRDDSNIELTKIKISLMQLSNLLSRVVYALNVNQISSLRNKIFDIESYYYNQKIWLGDKSIIIEEIINLTKEVINEFEKNVSSKSKNLSLMLNEKHFDYIICPTEEESKTLNEYLNISCPKYRPDIITMSAINENLVYRRKTKAILTGWPTSNNFDKIVSSFLFSKIVVLFYPFENKYYNSFQRMKKEKAKDTGFEDVYLFDETNDSTEASFDIKDYELRIDKTQYAKYLAKENTNESCKAKRLHFDNDTFMYATESHKFMIINELIYTTKSSPTIHFKKFEALHNGDVIAFINTERNYLVDMVANITSQKDFEEVSRWISLWKKSLDREYAHLNYNIHKLIIKLKSYGCHRHDATIRVWLNDEDMIGPESDDDLRAIARMTNNEILLQNIAKVREAIKTMTGWRMKTSDIIREKIKSRLLEVADSSLINSSIDIQDLGEVQFLRICELKEKTEEIDKRFVNRLIEKTLFDV